jgi:hypothetical protein
MYGSIDVRPLGDYQHYPASNVPVLTDAVRFRDFVEQVGSLDRKPKAPRFDKRSYFSKRVKGVAVKAVAECCLECHGEGGSVDETRDTGIGAR